MEQRDDNIVIVSCDMKALLEYIEKTGYITSWHLEKDWEYDKVAAAFIFMELLRRAYVSSDDRDYQFIEEAKVAFKVLRLTPLGKEAKEYAEPISMALKCLPAFSRMALECFNDLLTAARARGMGFEELEEMLKANSSEVEDLMDSTRLAVLRDFTSEELRQLARELGEF